MGWNYFTIFPSVSWVRLEELRILPAELIFCIENNSFIPSVTALVDKIVSYSNLISSELSQQS